MSRFKLINILDSIFLSIVTFLIIFAWLQFFIRQLFLSLFLSAILAIAIMLTLRWLKSKKYLSTLNKLSHDSDLIKFKLTIQTLPSARLVTLIKKLIPDKYTPKSNKGDIHFYKNNTLHICTFHYSSILSESEILQLIKTKKTNNLVIFCAEYTKETEAISSAFNNVKIHLVSLEELYQMFLKQNIDIDTSNINLNKSKISIKEVLKNSLSRKHSKGYFISGLILMFTSLIIPYKIYYVIFSSILLGLSLLCRIKRAPKASYSIFD